MKNNKVHLNQEACTKSIRAVQDTLHAINGKWKLPIIVALSSGTQRFTALQKNVSGITPKLLSKELRELEINGFITRTVHSTMPVAIEYALTEYSDTLDSVIEELRKWGMTHRNKIRNEFKEQMEAKTVEK